MRESYFTIEKYSEGIYKEKGSKFMAFAFPVKSKEEIKQRIEKLKQEHFSARHVCYAYSLETTRTEERGHDAGEPSGTAGNPILGQIQSKHITNVLVVVVRYFGGTLLGTGGLVNAYRSAARKALNHTVIVKKLRRNYYSITFPFDKMNEVMKLLKDEKAEQSEQSFHLECKLITGIPVAHAERIVTLLKRIGALQIHYIRTE